VDKSTFPTSRLDRLIDWIMNSPRFIIAGGVIVALAMISLCIFILFESRVDAYEHGQEESRNTLTLIERDITRNFELYALSLQQVVDTFDDPQLKKLPVDLQRAVLFDRAATAKYLGAMVVTDTRGRVRIDALGKMPVGTYVGDREFFTVQRDHPDTDLYISRPLSAQWRVGDDCIVLSRRLSHADGSFGGIVFVAVKLQYFHDLFSGLSLGAQSVVALVNTQGMFMAREPSRRGDTGRVVLRSQNLGRLLLADQGSFSALSGTDGANRLYVFQKIPNLPLILSVGTTYSSIYEAWQKRALWIGTVIVVFGLTFIGLSVMFVRQIKQRLGAEHALRLLAQTDGLTGLSNRRTLDELLGRAWRAAKRDGTELSVIFVDIDHFKAYNDTYGHHAGDEVLVAVAGCIGQCLQRADDAATRYGGEEFVILLPETGAKAAYKIAQRMLQAVRDLAMEHAGSDFARITISLGVATRGCDSLLDGHALIHAADQAVYEAKARGRNRIEIWSEPDSTPQDAPPTPWMA